MSKRPTPPQHGGKPPPAAAHRLIAADHRRGLVLEGKKPNDSGGREWSFLNHPDIETLNRSEAHRMNSPMSFQMRLRGEFVALRILTGLI